jgi:hypothetical protein
MNDPRKFSDVIDLFIRLGTAVTPVIASLALLVFFWGLVKFIRKSGEGDIKDGRDLMIWGGLALFVMVSVWGILRFLSGEFGFGGITGVLQLPS